MSVVHVGPPDVGRIRTNMKSRQTEKVTGATASRFDELDVKVVVDRLCELCESDRIFFRAVDLLHEAIVAMHYTEQGGVELLAAGAYIIASKIEPGGDTNDTIDRVAPLYKTGAWDADDTRAVEVAILEALKFAVSEPTTYQFIEALTVLSPMRYEEVEAIAEVCRGVCSKHNLYMAHPNSLIADAAVHLVLSNGSTSRARTVRYAHPMREVMRLSHTIAGSAYAWGSVTRAYVPKFAVTWEPDLHYERGRVLGKGSFGVVQLATNRQTAEECVIKEMRSFAHEDTDGMEETILREVSSLVLMPAHPNIVTLMEAHIGAQYRVFIVYALEAMDLRRHAASMGGGLAETRTLVTHLLLGVDHIHSYGFLHGDLKPENILMSAGGTLRVADLGGSAFVSLAGGPGPLGYGCTISYRSPEEILGGPPARTQAVDDWAVAIIAFELMARKYVYTDIMPVATQMDMNRAIPIDFAGGYYGPVVVSEWPAAEGLEKYKPQYTVDLKSPRFPWGCDDAVRDADFRDFLERLLVLNPDTRMTTEQALVHPFIQRGAKPRARTVSERIRERIRNMPEVFRARGGRARRA